jgi:hypothetical protein
LVGDSYDVVLTVTNTGGMTATGVAGTMWFDTGGLPASLVAGPAGPVDIPAGGSQYFTWSWVAVNEGVFAVTATATGIDSCRGWSVTAGGAGSIEVRGPGRLWATLFVEPSTVVMGGQVNVILTVSNTGVTNVNNVSNTIWVQSGAALVSKFSEPVDLPVLAPGDSAKFTWVYDAVSMGDVTFAVTTTGVEATLGNFVSASAYADLAILSKGVLSAQLTLTPATVVSGGTVRAVARVWNSAPAGSLDILDVEAVPGPPVACPAVPQISTSLFGTAAVVPGITPPAGCSSLGVGNSAFYTWTFVANGIGYIDFSVSFTGTQDATPVEYAYAYAVRRLSILAPAALSATLSVSPACGSPCTANYGNTIKVRMDVGNTSGSAASGVHPLTLTVTGSALSLVSSPSTNRYIPGFSNYIFEWTYLVTGSGSASLYCQAGGTEFTLLTPLWSNSTSVWIGVPAPSAINVVVTGPDTMVFGQDVVLPVSVTNVSTTSMIQAGFQVLWNGSTAGVTVVSTDPVLPKMLAPGTTRDFQVTIRLDSKAEAGDGTLQVLVDATEQYSSLEVQSQGGRLPIELLELSASDPTGTRVSVNPWKPSMGDLEIRYVVPAIAAGGTVTVKVYTLGGDLVRTLVNEAMPAGSHPARWDGRNSRGQKVASGVYLLLVETKAGKRLQKLAVIK